LLTGLETSEFGAEALEFRVGGGGIVGRIAAKLSEFLTKGEELSLDISVEGIDCEATARGGRGFGISHCRLLSTNGSWRGVGDTEAGGVMRAIKTVR
jgi:hypothetical protein